jgi:hypothetical protein
MNESEFKKKSLLCLFEKCVREEKEKNKVISFQRKLKDFGFINHFYFLIFMADAIFLLFF